MKKQLYIPPVCKTVHYTSRLNNSYGDDTGLITISGDEVDASLGESNESHVWDEEEAKNTSVWALE